MPLGPALRAGAREAGPLVPGLPIIVLARGRDLRQGGGKWAFGDFFFASTDNEEYHKYRSLKTAIEKYEKAHTLDDQAYNSRFAYAQAVGVRAEKQGNRGDADISRRLFGKVFAQAKEDVAKTTEAAALITLYYSSCYLLQRSGNTDRKPDNVSDGDTQTSASAALPRPN
jgi:hypothetical protein